MERALAALERLGRPPARLPLALGRPLRGDAGAARGARLPLRLEPDGRRLPPLPPADRRPCLAAGAARARPRGGAVGAADVASSSTTGRTSSSTSTRRASACRRPARCSRSGRRARLHGRARRRRRAHGGDAPAGDRPRPPRARCSSASSSTRAGSATSSSPRWARSPSARSARPFISASICVLDREHLAHVAAGDQQPVDGRAGEQVEHQLEVESLADLAAGDRALEHRAQRGPAGLDEVGAEDREQLGVVDGLPEQARHQRGGAAARRARPHRGGERRVVAAQAAGVGRVELVVEEDDRVAHELLLGGPAAVDRRLADAGPRPHGLHRQRAVAGLDSSSSVASMIAWCEASDRGRPGMRRGDSAVSLMRGRAPRAAARGPGGLGSRSRAGITR